MAKWADFIITKKRMNLKKTHIDRVWVCPDLDISVGTGTDTARQDVVAGIKRGVTYVTAYKNAQGNFDKGERVILDPVNGVEYIKTLPDRTERDNLDSLPDY
jgi:hypothetical protein